MVYADVQVTTQKTHLHVNVVEGFVEKELVYQTLEGYIVYDRFFSIWLKRL